LTVNELFLLLARIAGHDLPVEQLPEQAGDVRATGGAIERAQELLGWSPRTSVADGLAAQYAWQQSLRRRS